MGRTSCTASIPQLCRTWSDGSWASRTIRKTGNERSDNAKSRKKPETTKASTGIPARVWVVLMLLCVLNVVAHLAAMPGATLSAFPCIGVLTAVERMGGHVGWHPFWVRFH